MTAKNFNECNDHFEMLSLIDRTPEEGIWLLFQFTSIEEIRKGSFVNSPRLARITSGDPYKVVP